MKIGNTMLRLSTVLLVLVGAGSFAVVRAEAQATPAPAEATPPAAAGSGAPDVVRLRSGGLLRGTIAEYIPESHVVMVLITGETRRIESAEIAYAGPVEGAAPATTDLPAAVAPEAPPAASSPAAPPDEVPPGEVRVQLSPGRPDAAFFATLGGRMRLLCSGPCAGRLPAGPLRFGMSVDGRDPIRADVYLDLRDGDVVDGMYRNRRGGRIAARVIGGIFAVGGLVGVIAGIAARHECVETASAVGLDPGCRAPAITGGVSLALGAGLLMGSAAMDDEVTVSVRGRPEAVVEP